MEKWDLLDNKRRPTGKFIYRGDVVPEGFYHQVVHVCIFNKDGKMLIQKRHPSKKKWAKLWDISCGGAAIRGEDTHQAASRELFEELGIDHDFSKEKFLLTITYEKGFDDYFCLIYDFLDIKSLKIQKEELTDIRWASLDSIEDMIDSGDFVPYSKDMIGLIFKLKDAQSYIG